MFSLILQIPLMRPKYQVLLVLSLLIYGFGYGQSTCANATRINNLPYTTPGLLGSETTCGAGNNYTKSEKCGNRYMSGEEFMYVYTPNTNQCINLTVTPSGLGNDTPTALFVTEGCPDDPNGKCMAQFINTTADALPKPSTITNLQLTAGKTYYFQVTSQTECFAFSFNATAGNGCTPDATGYDCDDADEISALPYTYSGTSCNKKSILNEGNECYSTFYSGTGYIFKYTPSKTECIEIKGRATDQTTRFSIHNECPTISDTTCVRSRYFYTFAEYTYYETLDSGKTYYFVTNSTTTAPGCGAYDFTINEISDEGTTCDLAYDLQGSSVTYPQHTTQCKGDFYNESELCSNFYDDGNEVLYKYEAVGNECVVASATNMTSYGSIQLYKGCPLPDNSNQLAIDDRCGWNDPQSVTIEYTFTTPGTYYFVVSGRRYTSTWSDTYYDFNYDFQFSTSVLDDLGVDCAHADTLASTIPSRKDSLSVQCKGDDYQEADGCNSLIEGSDYVMVYIAPEDFCGSIVARNTAGKGGITLMKDCPGTPGNQCLGSVSCPSLNCDSIFLDYTFVKGETYYIIASGNGGNFFSFDIEVKKSFNTKDGCESCKGVACVECENANFEKSSLVNWTGRFGTYANPGQNAGFNAGSINDLESGHTIMNGGLDDPMVGSLVKTSGPLGGRYSLRLGNYISGGKGEQISFDINVTNETKNFFYYYAVVFEDPPGHTETDQPFFGVEMVDASGNSIECAAYQVRSSNAEGFKEVETIPNDRNIATVKYKDWSLVAVPLDDYLGQTVTITFTATDCGLSGHMGYAYIDAFCGDLDIETVGGAGALCPGESVTLKAPEGFADYLWSTGATTQEITVNTAGNYTVILTPFAANPLLDCKITLDYEVVVSPNPIADFTFDEGCNDAFIEFYSTSTGGGTGIDIDNIHWDFGDGSTGTSDTIMHEFPGPGNYNVTITAVNSNGCTHKKTIPVTIDPYTKLDPLNAKDTIEVCVFTEVEFTSDLLSDVSYTWTGPNGLSQTSNNFFFLPEELSDSGWYYLEAISTNDPCVKAYDSTFLYLEAIPELAIIADTTICFSDSVFNVYASGGMSYQWLPNEIYSNPNGASTDVTMPFSDSIHVKLSFNLCPDSTLGSFITVDRPAEYLNVQSDTSICIGESFALQNAADPLDYLMWINPIGDSVFVNPYEVETSNLSDSGTYRLIAYLADDFYCPFDSLDVDVTVLPLPNLTPNVTPESCPGTRMQMSCSGASNYEWYNASGDLLSNMASFDSVFYQSEWLYVVASDDYLCENNDSVEVKIFEDFTVQLGNDKKRCKGDFALLEINSSDFYDTPSSVVWSTGAQTNSIEVSDQGFYWVDVTINGCTKRDSLYLTIQDPASFSLGNDTLLCQGESLVLDVSSYSGAIIWNDGDDSSVKTISYPGGEFSVEIVSGQCVLKDTITINYQNQHAITIGPAKTVCVGEALQYSTSESGINTWTVNGTSTVANSIELTAAGSYNIVLENQKNACAARDTIQSVIQSKPQGLLPDTVLICEFDSVEVDATIAEGDAYSWNDGNANANRYLKTAGMHVVQIQAGACVIFDTTFVVVTVLPTPDLGPDTSICSTETVQLINNTSGTQRVNWYFNGTVFSTNPTSVSVNATGEYVLEIGQGTCFTSDTIVVQVDVLPVFDLGRDTSLCPQQTLQLSTGYPMYGNLWQDGKNDFLYTVTSSGKYAVTVTNGKCTAMDSIEVNYINTQIPDLGPDTAICDGQSIFLNTKTSNYDSLFWNDNSSNPDLFVNTPGTYFSNVYFGQCKVTDTIKVDVLTIPVFDLGPDIKVCEDVVVTIGTSLPYVHLWNTGATTDSISIAANGNYSLSLFNQHCIYSDDVDVEFVTAPIVDLGPDLLRCTGESDELYGPAGNYTYTWNGVDENQSKTISVTNTYVLVVSDGFCTRSDTMFAEYTIPTNPNLPPENSICSTDSVYIDASVINASYLWNTGATSPDIFIDSTGEYYVDIQQGGCLNRYLSNLYVTPEPVLNLGDDVTVCADEIVALNTNLEGFETYWSTTENSSVIQITTPGTYSVRVTDGPCNVFDTVTVLHNPLPVLPTRYRKVCPNDSLLLNLSKYAKEIVWSDGLNSLTRYVLANDKFDVVLINEFDCEAAFHIDIDLDYDCPDPIYVPNAFTPDGDGINDVFKPVMPGVKLLSFSIYNRWGELIYKTTDSNEGWDGDYREIEAKGDVYVWRMEYVDKYNNEQVEEGRVNLLR